MLILIPLHYEVVCVIMSWNGKFRILKGGRRWFRVKSAVKRGWKKNKTNYKHLPTARFWTEKHFMVKYSFNCLIKFSLWLNCGISIALGTRESSTLPSVLPKNIWKKYSFNLIETQSRFWFASVVLLPLCSVPASSLFSNLIKLIEIYNRRITWKVW